MGLAMSFKDENGQGFHNDAPSNPSKSCTCPDYRKGIVHAYCPVHSHKLPAPPDTPEKPDRWFRVYDEREMLPDVKTPTSGDELDRLLREVRDAGALDDNNGGEDWTLSEKTIRTTEAAIRRWVLDTIIGVDDDDRPEITVWQVHSKEATKARNQLRAEQRKRLSGGLSIE